MGWGVLLSMDENEPIYISSAPKKQVCPNQEHLGLGVWLLHLLSGEPVAISTIKQSGNQCSILAGDYVFSFPFLASEASVVSSSWVQCNKNSYFGFMIGLALETKLARDNNLFGVRKIYPFTMFFPHVENNCWITAGCKMWLLKVLSKHENVIHREWNWAQHVFSKVAMWDKLKINSIFHDCCDNK